MARKTLEINGTVFELGKDVTREEIGYTTANPHRTLFDCYATPSKAKMGIYNSWLKWSNETKAQGFTISSYNPMYFSVEMYVTVAGETYFLHITKSHNIASKFVEQ